MSELRRDYEKKTNKKLIIIIWIIAIVLNVGYLLYINVPKWMDQEETVLDQIERNDVEVVTEVIDQIKEEESPDKTNSFDKGQENLAALNQIIDDTKHLLIMGLVLAFIGAILNVLKGIT